MNILPIIVVGGALLFAMKKKKAKTAKNGAETNDKKALPENGRGTVFYESDLPDLIKARVGERFSISFADVSGSTGYLRKLAASPPDNSVELVKQEFDESGNEEMLDGSSGGQDVFIFKGAKKGKGSLVFHVQAPWLEGKEPPAEIVEIQTEIS